MGAYDILIGINLLREGLDIPECALVAILDADKEGFLRSETSLIQTIGRAARNIDGRVLLYADKMTGSMERALAETKRRREKQNAHNEANNITPASVQKNIGDLLEGMAEAQAPLLGDNLRTHIEQLEKKMQTVASDLEFEEAARLRDEIKRLQQTELVVANDPLARPAEVEKRVSEATGSKMGRKWTPKKHRRSR